tara:strand:- start:1754 stop:2116 length:363 start_codon:yes stop_codon:yes gene_type:complete
MITAGPAAGIAHGSSDGPEQAHVLVDLGKEPDTTIAGDVTATEIGFNFSSFNGWKWKQTLVAFCHGGISCCLGLDTLIFKIFPPFFYPLCEISGLGTSPPQITLCPETQAWQGFQERLTF